ncbi:MAG: response regulator [Bacteroidia bacterium]|nr:response regulator [Bacteroidia bacterium]
MKKNHTLHLLLVEDNPADVRLTREAIKECTLKEQIVLHVVSDGEEALRYLHHQPPYEESTLPDLILLDLNLPKKDGREVLTVIKQHQTLRRIPVIVLTTSNARRDVLDTYDLHANCFITKPVDIRQFIAIFQSIETFWFQVVQLPMHL